MLLFCYINDTKKYLTEIVFKTAGMQHSLGPIVVVSHLYLASLSFCLFAQTEYLYFCILCYLYILLSTWCRCISPRLWVWLSGASPIASQSAKTFFVVTFIFWIMHPIMFVCLPVWMHFFLLLQGHRSDGNKTHLSVEISIWTTKEFYNMRSKMKKINIMNIVSPRTTLCVLKVLYFFNLLDVICVNVFAKTSWWGWFQHFDLRTDKMRSTCASNALAYSESSESSLYTVEMLWKTFIYGT